MSEVRVAAIGDLHVSDGKPHSYRELFAEISERADLLALCGDLTNLGRPHEAEMLAEDLRACRIPAIGVLGNHDYECGQAEEVMRILQQAGMLALGDEVHEIAGIGVAGVKGFAGGFDNRMLGAFGEPAIKHFVEESVREAMRLENALHALSTDRVLVVLHYSPIAATVQGEPGEIYPFLGSSRLAETIDRFPNVRAVVHGHAHHGVFQGHTAKGIPVYNCAQTVAKPDDHAYALFTL